MNGVGAIEACFQSQRHDAIEKEASEEDGCPAYAEDTKADCDP